MDLTKLTKVESSGPRRAALEKGGTMTAIIKVSRKGYRPAGVKVRGEISGDIFTAEFPAAKLADLEKDDGVASISPARSLEVQK